MNLASHPDNILPLPLPEPDPLIPSPLDTPRFQEVWRQWMKHRRHLKKPKSWGALFRMQLEWLSEYDEETAYQTVRFSLHNAYQGLFPDRFRRNLESISLSPIDKVILYDELKRLQKRIPALKQELAYHPGAKLKSELAACRLRADEIRARLGIQQ